jgi:hypothetical protein
LYRRSAARSRAIEDGLRRTGTRLAAYELTYSIACEHALGRQLGDARPTRDELAQLEQWIDELEQTVSALLRGQSFDGRQVRVYRTEYERHRPVVEISVPGSGRGVAWTGASRHSQHQAKADGAYAALMALLGQPFPPAGEDDEPDPDVVKAAHAALEAEKARIAQQPGVTARGSTAAELEAAQAAARTETRE